MAKVWRRFQKTNKDGEVKKFKIQEIPKELYENVCKFMIDNYIYEEPFSLASGLLNEPDGIDRTKKFWLYAMSQNLCIICLEDNEEEDIHKDIVAANILLRNTINGSSIPVRIYYLGWSTRTREWAREPESILRIIHNVSERIDVCHIYGVEEYLGDDGLAVSSKYRKMGIAVEMLLARTPLCKELGLKVTETIFTSKGSQISAERSGFSTLIEIETSEIENIFNITFPEDCKSFKIMGKVIE